MSVPITRALGNFSATRKMKLEGKLGEILRQRYKKEEKQKRLAFKSPYTRAGPQVDNLLRLVPDGGYKVVAVKNVVEVEAMLDTLAKLLGLVIGQAVAIGDDSLVPPTKKLKKKELVRPEWAHKHATQRLQQPGGERERERDLV